MSVEEQAFYRRAALEAAFFDWERLPPRYRSFITHLFKTNRQKTLDYFLHHTVLGSLRFDLKDPVLFQQILSLLEADKENNNMPSLPELSFAFLLAFKSDYCVKYFCKLLRENKLPEEDFWHLLERVKHNNEPKKQPND